MAIRTCPECGHESDEFRGGMCVACAESKEAESADEPCLICGKPVSGYVPQYCCHGRDCGCGGLPVEPCVCSAACDHAVYAHIGLPFDQRRIAAGIELWTPENTSDNGYTRGIESDTALSPGALRQIVESGTISLTWLTPDKHLA